MKLLLALTLFLLAATPAPSPTQSRAPLACRAGEKACTICFRDAFSDDGVVPENAAPCVRINAKPTHVASPPPIVILCAKDKEHCKIYKLHNGAYELIETATPWPNISP